MWLWLSFLAVTLLPATSDPATGTRPLGEARTDSAVWVLDGHVIRSNSNQRLSDAEVWVEGAAARAETDTGGHFTLSVRIASADTVWVRARHYGFFAARGAIPASVGNRLVVEIGMDPTVRGFDYTGSPPPTPGYVRVVQSIPTDH
jgi:hypothetical protein